MSFYNPGWRANDAGGETRWADAWAAGNYAQQIKGAGGGPDADYLNRFDQLTKSDSSVDDEEGWRTVTNLRNNDSANIASIQKQAEEWKSKGFDVRVQDLDESHGAQWADLAVRKTPGQRQEQAPAEPTQPSPELVAARGTWDDFEARRGEGSIHFNPTGDGIGDAADYGNRATDDYVNRFVPHLNAQANLEAHEMGGSGNYHMNRLEGEPTELASSDIKDIYNHYSKQIKGIA